MELGPLVDLINSKGWSAMGRQRPHEEPLEKWERFPVDWDQLPRGDELRKEDLAPNRDRDQWRQQWENVVERVEGAHRNWNSPPPSNVDALAWYLPFHRFGVDSGIYIKEDAVIELAGRSKAYMMVRLDPVLETKQLIQQALAILYFHEMFHHRIECFATRLEIARGSAVYIPYEDNVFFKVLGTDLLLEEAFACADMFGRLDERRYAAGIDKRVRAATREFLKVWIPKLEPGYRLGLEAHFHRYVGEVLSQVLESTPHPKMSSDDWRYAPDMTRGFFRVDSVMKVIIPKGATPVIPWLDTSL